MANKAYKFRLYPTTEQEQLLLNLQKAYANFFAGRAKFPKFKSRKNKQS